MLDCKLVVPFFEKLAINIGPTVGPELVLLFRGCSRVPRKQCEEFTPHSAEIIISFLLFEYIICGSVEKSRKMHAPLHQQALP